MNAEYPASTASRAQSATSSIVANFGFPHSSAIRARYVARCDQYTRCLSLNGPPTSLWTGTPCAFPLMSHSASSMPAIAMAVAPPDAERVCRYISMYSLSTGSGSWPISDSPKSSTSAGSPRENCPVPYSEYPVMPSSVRIAQNSHGIRPSPRTAKFSMPVIFIPNPQHSRHFQQSKSAARPVIIPEANQPLDVIHSRRISGPPLPPGRNPSRAPSEPSCSYPPPRASP